MLLSAHTLKEMAQNTDVRILADVLVAEGKLVKGKDKLSFLCPYHDDSHASFKIYVKGNGFKCFSCPVNFKKPIAVYMDLYEVKYPILACIDICYKTNQLKGYEHYIYLREYYEGAIRNNDINTFTISERAKSNAVVNNYQQFNYTLDTFSDVVDHVLKDFDINSLPPLQVLNKIYGLFLRATEITRGSRLIQEHIEHLKNIRKLSDAEIDKQMFFTLGNQYEAPEIMSHFLNLLFQNNIDVNYLKITPGFIYNPASNSYSFIASKNQNTLVIPIKSIDQGIQRLQLRVTSYRWFATPGASNCKSPSTTEIPDYLEPLFLSNVNIDHSQIDELISHINENGGITIAVTEGKFKALAIKQYLNIICIAIQGLGSWTSACIAIEKIKIQLINKGIKIKEVLIIFDSDTKVKHGLMNHGKNLSRVIRNEKITCSYISWKSELGKGYDDMALEGHSEKVVHVESLLFEERHDLIIQIISFMLMKPISELKKEDLEPYYEVIEDKTTEELKELIDRYKYLTGIAQKRLKREPSKEEFFNICKELQSTSIEQLSYIYNYNV